MRTRSMSLLLALMLALSLASTAVAYASITTEATAVINNPNPEDRLNLRTRPSEDAPTLGKYYSGTGLHLRQSQSTSSSTLGLYRNGQTVLVYGVSASWCHVQAEDGEVGFMLRERLSPVIDFKKNR